MLDFIRLRQKIKYNSILRILHDGLVKIGINITFFYLVEEGLHLQEVPFETKEFKDYKIEFLDDNDLDSICSIPERPLSKEKLLERMTSGCRCLIIKKNEDVAGYTWFNLCEITFEAYKFPLKENEAYLFDAYVLIENRGNRIAPFMRNQSYKELKKLNRIILYSISDSLNNQSISFKKKLNAKFLYLMLYINLFKKLKFTKQIKKISR